MDEREQIKLPLPDKATFSCADDKTQHNILFDLLMVNLQNTQDIFTMVQKNKASNMTVSGMFGFIGAGAVVAAKWLFTGKF